MTTDDWLGASLANGPLDSREVKRLADHHGITPKSLRNARQRVGVEVSRSGSRAAMRSTWTLGVADVSEGAQTLSTVPRARTWRHAQGRRRPRC